MRPELHDSERQKKIERDIRECAVLYRNVSAFGRYWHENAEPWEYDLGVRVIKAAVTAYNDMRSADTFDDIEACVKDFCNAHRAFMEFITSEDVYMCYMRPFERSLDRGVS